MSEVYVAEALRKYRAVQWPLESELRFGKIPMVEIPGTENIWVRDWMPIPVHDHYVKFRPSFSEALYPHLHVPETCWNYLPKLERSNIMLDGGNVVRHGSRVIMTDIIFRQNPTVPEGELIEQLEELLEAEITIIPAEPGDDLGHADGIVAWIDAERIFLNDYRCMRDPVYQAYEANVRCKLEQIGRTVVPMAFGYNRCPDMVEEDFRAKHPAADDFNPAFGYYTNFLHVGNMVLFPKFALAKDYCCEDALFAAFPEHYLRSIDCSKLSMLGGCVHCVTWESCQ